MRKIIKLYICLVTVLGTMTGYAQDIENGGGYGGYGGNTGGYSGNSGTTKLNEVIVYNNYHNPIVIPPGPTMYIPPFVLNPLLPYPPVITGGGTSGGGGSQPKPPTEPDPKPDPCAQAKSASASTTAISKDTNFTSAKKSIAAASANDGLEHGITLGRNTSGQITQAPMKTGGLYNVPINTTWPGAFAALHNHVYNSPPSAGDVYTAVKLNTGSSNFTTSFINLPNGSSYAIVVTDLVAAKNFVATYPADEVLGYSPEFPDFLFNQLQDLVTQMGSSVDGKIEAIAFTLDKYNSGLTFLKQDVDGQFKPIKIVETVQQDGTKTYSLQPCK